MFIRKMLRKKRCFIYVISCLAVLYLFSAFIRFVSKSLKGKYLTVRLPDVSPVKIYYSELSRIESRFTVVLLYTSSMKTRTWEKTNTPKILQDAGYRVLCIHLPVISEDGKEPSYPLKGGILADVLKQLNALDCILVAQSKTGSYALPVVVRGGYNIRAFVAISPLDGTNFFTTREYQILQTPTLIVYGSGDKSSSAAVLESLSKIPNREIVEITGSGHNFYVDRPDDFNRILLEYVKKIDKSIVNIK